MDKLNLGSGPDYRQGFVNVDQAGKCDVIHDLSCYPWPFKDSRFDEILALDIIEHMPRLVPFMDECHRVMAVGGLLSIRTPNYTAEFGWIDPEHYRLYALDTMDFFDPATPYGRYNVHLTDKKWVVVKKERTENDNLQFQLRKIVWPIA